MLTSILKRSSSKHNLDLNDDKADKTYNEVPKY